MKANSSKIDLSLDTESPPKGWAQDLPWPDPLTHSCPTPPETGNLLTRQLGEDCDRLIFLSLLKISHLNLSVLQVHNLWVMGDFIAVLNEKSWHGEIMPA